MKILLVGINAKYIHSNLAIRSLRNYATPYKEKIFIDEYTINQYTDEILMDIFKQKPDFIGFSCYIWNIAMVKRLSREIKKVLPKTSLWLGGPETSYNPKDILEELIWIDGVICGEGEETFLELMHFYVGHRGELTNIKGICFREIDGSTQLTPARRSADMDTIPFPYEDLTLLANKLIYYESERGCPYSCSYCLSAADKGVRFRNLDKVKEELLVFLQNNVPQVKFVDRTFNCNHKHAMEIWRFLKENDNGITNFHFEIAGELLTEEELGLLKTLRVGLIQLEIGVQSANEVTLDAIRRKMSLNKIREVVYKIQEGRNIHVHLDLIAGLPFEDYASFRSSFNEVYSMKPDQLQLGFLKVLKGSPMYEEKEKWGIEYQEEAPYEVLYTKWISYEEILQLKKVESMTEIYYNSGQFEYSLTYLMHFFETPFDFFLELGNYYEEQGLLQMSSSRLGRYEALLTFLKIYNGGSRMEEAKVLGHLMVHDLYCREKLKSRPPFAEDFECYKKRYQTFYRDSESLLNYLEWDAISMEEVKGMLHIEHYPVDIYKTAESGRAVSLEQFILYDYKNRSPLNKQARQISIYL